MTNADKIRAMGDEELAEYLCRAIMEGLALALPGVYYSKSDIEELNKEWLDMLRREAE